MKKIIFFRGAVESQEFFSLQLSKAFELMGYDTFFVNLQNIQGSMSKLTSFIENGETIAISFNFNGIAGEEFLYDENDGSFFDINKIPVYNIVVDHPFYYHDYLKIAPKDYHHINIDLFHQKYMKKYFPHIDSDYFLPLGGTDIRYDEEHSKKFPFLSQKDRDTDIIFTGNFTHPDTFDKYIERNGDDYTRFYHGIIDDLLSNPQKVLEDVIEEHVLREIGEVSMDEMRDVMKNMIFIDLYVRFYEREKAVAAIVDAGYKLHIIGKGFDAIHCKHPENIIEHGFKNSFTCLLRIADSKLSLNVMPWFKNGAHDRIYNSMLNGAISISDDSIFLRKEFEDKKDIMFYSLENIGIIPDLINDLLKDDDKRQEIAYTAYEKTIIRDSWDIRAKTLERIIKSNE
ncbi:Glycosyl transferases group 1 [Acetitomaculum ruminis DSM 5522]|uniref:Glycosyl transferases group 1 n=1 Tax=Acetitomaculum ruminis DSM 5522 TaxID=1120918 RepID=A0A1I0VT82_9FIRM|nr:glycosyltransferase [Acetitomaculum ruminis]SFA79163.1 Glycosyl transferases group 1 [Acetitomaculum ruminis DSM 5522]